jgi:hypothetical protein
MTLTMDGCAYLRTPGNKQGANYLRLISGGLALIPDKEMACSLFLVVLRVGLYIMVRLAMRTELYIRSSSLLVSTVILVPFSW